jgi:Right handed beta helix region
MKAIAGNFWPMMLFSRTASRAREMFQKLEDRTLLSSWYVSTSGSDTAAGSLTAPFRTIQHAANIAEPGDTVLIRAGVYHETVVPAHSGTSSKPITYERYKNESVTIDGADAISGWSLYKGSIYEAKVPWTLGEGNDQVYVDGVMMNEARYPNTSLDVSHPTYGIAQNVVAKSNGANSSATLYDSGLTQSSGAWVGATMHILAGQGWYLQTGAITASSPGQVTFSYSQDTIAQIPSKGNKFYITGKMVALDSPGEWYHDPSTGMLYIWMPKGDTTPTGHTIEMKHRPSAFDLSGKSYINVDNLSIFSCRILTDANSSHLDLNGLTATYLSQFGTDVTGNSSASVANQTGIVLNGLDNTLENSTIAFSAGNGVWLGGTGETVRNCVIHDCGYFGDNTAAISAERVTTSSTTSDLNIAYNTVYNCGRDGILFSFAHKVQVMHNVVHDCMLQTTDGGCLYTFGTDGTGSEIGYNVCYNAHAAINGASGIFMDSEIPVFSGNFLIDHNVVWNTDHALKFNPTAQNNIIVNNTFVGNQDGIASSHTDDLSGCIFANNIITGNIAHVTGATFENNVLSMKYTWSTSTFKNNIMDVTNPGFVNAAADNFQLLSTSPAVNNGMLWSPYTNGYAGVAPDIGAFESNIAPFAAGSSLIPPPPFI